MIVTFRGHQQLQEEVCFRDKCLVAPLEGWGSTGGMILVRGDREGMVNCDWKGSCPCLIIHLESRPNMRRVWCHREAVSVLHALRDSVTRIFSLNDFSFVCALGLNSKSKKNDRGGLQREDEKWGNGLSITIVRIPQINDGLLDDSVSLFRQALPQVQKQVELRKKEEGCFSRGAAHRQGSLWSSTGLAGRQTQDQASSDAPTQESKRSDTSLSQLIWLLHPSAAFPVSR